MKRIVFALLALTLLISMASCAETAKETETKTEEITAATQEAEEITTEETKKTEEESQMAEIDYSDAHAWASVIHLTEDYIGGHSEDVLEELTFIINQYGGQNIKMAQAITKIYKSFHTPECEKYIQEAEMLLESLVEQQEQM